MLVAFRAGIRKDRFGQTQGKKGSGSKYNSLQRIKSVRNPHDTGWDYESACLVSVGHRGETGK